MRKTGEIRGITEPSPCIFSPSQVSPWREPPNYIYQRHLMPYVPISADHGKDMATVEEIGSARNPDFKKCRGKTEISPPPPIHAVRFVRGRNFKRASARPIFIRNHSARKEAFARLHPSVPAPSLHKKVSASNVWEISSVRPYHYARLALHTTPPCRLARGPSILRKYSTRSTQTAPMYEVCKTGPLRHGGNVGGNFFAITSFLAEFKSAQNSILV